MKFHDELKTRHLEFIARQKIFFVASAPLASQGHVTLSPKGLDSLAVLDAQRIAYIDLGGSGIETQAHVQENGRLCVMFCSFEGAPLIVRLYGQGLARQWGSPGFEALRDHFPAISVPVRGIIELRISEVQDSCGWGVPLFDYRGDREELTDYNAKRSQEEFAKRGQTTNARSLDGLPGLIKI